MEVPHSHDLRAASTISRRARTRAEKYFGFRYIKAGQIHQPHYRLLDSNDQHFTPNSGLFLSQSKHENLTPIEYFTPKRLYQEAQYWPRPPTYHRRHKDKLDKRSAVITYESRMVIRRETGRMLREVEGPRVGWRDAEPERSYGEFEAGCTICAQSPECIDKKSNDYNEASTAETLASHHQSAVEPLLDEALERWASEQEKSCIIDEWIMLGCSDADFGFGMEFEDEVGDSDSQWTLIDA